MNEYDRLIQIKMRFNQTEVDALAALAEQNGLSLAGQVRALLHAATIREPQNERDHNHVSTAAV